MSTNDLPSPYLLFMGDVTEPGYAKTAFGLRDWAPDMCIGELDYPSSVISTGLPRLSAKEAVARGAKALVIGVANPGGVITPAWRPALVEALREGLSIISGMHARLEDDEVLAAVARETGQKLVNVRTPPTAIPIGTGARRTGRRLLTVGTDCALGKKYSALAIARAFQERGLGADFRATGQTGIMIAGGGIPIDSVVTDFIAGAAEMLSPAAEPDHWDIIEGQGSLYHPAYAAVTIGLLHGSQPDVLVLCHHATRKHIIGHPGYPLPRLKDAIDTYLDMTRIVSPNVRLAGISVNTADLGAGEAEKYLEEQSRLAGLPAADPMRGGAAFETLVDSCLGETEERRQCA